MKKFIYLIIGLSFGMSAKAQYYSFSKSTQNYADITGADIIDTAMQDYISFLPDHPFKIFGKTGITSFSIGVETGYLVAASPQYGFALDPMMGTVFRKIPGQSSVSIKEIITSSDTLLLVQWKQIGLKGHPDNEFLNFQVSISLSKETVTYHYGSSNYVRISNDSAFMNPSNTGPEVMLVLLYPDFSNYYEFNTLSGNPANPLYSSNYARMTSIPAPNQLYTFRKRTSVGMKEAVGVEGIRIYPNPSIDKKIHISSPETIGLIKIYSVTGKLVLVQKGGGDLTLPSDSQLFYAEITLVNGERCVKKILAP